MVGAEGAAAVAVALSKLVNLTSLDLRCTWNVEWVVSCVHVVSCVCVSCACRGRSAVCGYAALYRMWCCRGTRNVADVKVCWDQTMSLVLREQRQWRVR